MNAFRVAIAIAVIVVTWISAVSVGGVIKENQALQQYKTDTQSQIKKLEDEKTKLQNEKIPIEELKTKVQDLDKRIEELKQAKANAKIKLASATMAMPVKTAPPTIRSEEEAMRWIIAHEGDLTSVNPKSWACGMPQSNPCEKLLIYAGVAPAGFRVTSYAMAKEYVAKVPEATQIAWMTQYVMGRYGSFVNAKAFWQRNGSY